MNSKMKTWEWIGLIIATIIIDIVQVILTFFAIGLILNRIIDVVVGAGLPAYYWLRKVPLNDWKRIAAIVGAFAIEEVGLGGDDGLPFWTLEVAIVWFTVAAEKKIPALGKLAAIGQQSGKNRPHLNKDGMRLPPISTATGTSGSAGHISSYSMPPLNDNGVRRPTNAQVYQSNTGTGAATKTQNPQELVNNLVANEA